MEKITTDRTSEAFAVQSEEDEDEWIEREDDDDEDVADILSEVSSVPTTVASATDERVAAASLRAQREANRIFSAGLMVIAAFVVVAVILSVSIYGYATKEENEHIHELFEVQAELLVDNVDLRMEDLMHQLQNLALSISSFALGTGNLWPMVTVPNFQAQASQFLSQSPSTSKNTTLSLSVLVEEAQRQAWENFTISNQGWIQESYAYLGLTETSNLPAITPFIYRTHAENGTIFRDPGDSTGVYAPIWMSSVTDAQAIDQVNFNAMSVSTYLEAFNVLSRDSSTTVVTPPITSGISIVVTPLLESSSKRETSSDVIVGTLSTEIAWDSFFSNVLDDDDNGPIVVVLQDSCGRCQQFQIQGSQAEFVATTWEPELPADVPTLTSTLTNVKLTNGCPLVIHIAASSESIDSASTTKPMSYAVGCFLIFAVMGLFFCAYDRFAGKSYHAAISKVERTKSLVESMFPSNVRDRVLNEKTGKPHSEIVDPLNNSRRGLAGKPIADLHPSVTVLFADIANFTAWSSVREPSQVFLLLETLYNSFDLLTKKYQIFKIETIGDCYVAVSGLPEPNEYHAVSMARFAIEIVYQMQRDVKRLEVSLGPDTGDLAMRVGINSGPVTAGVLRGEKSRFQLFGDTVNVASRMESTGERNKIHVSSDTAKLIEQAGKKSWLTPREDMVQVKGKGAMKTFWLSAGESSYSTQASTGSPSQHRRESRLAKGFSELDNSIRSEDCSNISPSVASPEEKKERLITWSADLLLGLLKRIVAMRESEETLNELKEFQEIVKGLDEMGGISTRASVNIDGLRTRREPTIRTVPGYNVLDEVAEIINLPQKKASRYQQDPGNVELGDAVVKQLYRFVREIAKMYRSNPFHNFEHASHVTQSLTKLLSRVVAPDAVDYEHMTYKKKAATSKLHKFTFGITSDPITQFACAFSSLIHDLDHPGVPNAVLVKEETEIAKKYRNKSVAEQNSVDLAWSLLMQPRFSDLRSCIYTNQAEFDRFRQLVVNSVMATDIVDKELGQLRKKRWERAFTKTSDEESKERVTEDVNRKATIVIEHLIQAADVAHTMQHWHVYLKWNERFFHECYAVYLSGRSDTDPSIGWYKGEIGFFDFYIIPLAKKLENCGVFGVSSDECLQYAKANREEWERKGEEIVKTYLAKYDRKEDSQSGLIN